MKTTKFSKRLLSLLLSLTVALSAFFGLPGGIAASATTTIPSAEKGGGLGISFVDSNSDSAQSVDRVVLTSALYLDGTYYVKVTNDYRSTASIESVSVSNGLSIASVTTVPGNGGVAYMFLSGKASSNNSICEITITYTLDGFEDYQNEQYSLTAKGFICCEYIQAQKSVDIACNYDAIQAQGYTQNVFAVASDAAWLTLKSVSGGCSVYDSTLAHDKVTSGETGSVEMDLYVDREAAGTVSWTELGLSHKIINRYTNKISVTAVPQFASDSNYSQVGSLSSGLTTSVNLNGTSGASSDTYYFNGTIPLGSTKNSAANIFSTSTALKLKASYYLNWSDMEVSIKFNVFSYDKSDLRDKIKICEGYCLNSALFDSQKWVVYQNALCAAKKVLGSSKTTQYAIYTALNNLNEAYTSLQRTCATDEQIADLRTFVNKYETVMNAPGNSYCWQAALLTDNKKYYDTALDYIDNQFTTTYENAEYLISKVSSFSYKTHRYSQDKKDATCTEDGYVKYSCSDCAYYYTETLNAKGHKMTPKVIAPTCTAVGYTIDVCSVCGIEDSTTKRNITGSLGHDYVYSTEKSKLPTCIASGKATYVCSRCSASYSQNVPAKGHTYKRDKSTYSCTKNGFQDWICVDCEDSYQEDVSATGHKWVLSKKTGSKATYVCANKQCLLQSDGTYKTAGFTTDGNIDPGLSATVVRTQNGYYASRYDCNSTDEYYIKLFNNTDSDVTVQSITMTNGLSVDFTEQTLSARELKQFRITGTPTKVNSISAYTVTYDSGVCENSIYCAKDEVAAEDSNFQKVSFNSSFQIGLNLNDIFGQIYVEPAADLKYAKAATADTCFPISEWNAYVDKENMFFSDDTEIGDDAQHFDNYTWNNTMLSLELTSFQSSNSYTLSPIDLFSNTDGTMNFFYTGSELTNSTVILDKVAQSETAWVFFSGKLPTGSAVFKNRSDWTIKESSSSQTKSFKYLAGNFRINAFTYNKEKLRATVTEYETLGLNASDYTESNWTMYKNALDRATEVLGKQKTNQEEVDAAREDLQVAYEGLYNFYATDAQINSLRAFVTKYEALSAGTDSKYCDRQNLLSAYKEYYDLAVEYIDNQFKTFYDEAANLVKIVSGFSYNEHKFVVSENVPADCTNGAYNVKVCAQCGYTYNETTSAPLGHTWGDWTPAGDHTTHTRTCSVCNETETADCSYSVTDSKDATCTEDGYKTYTCSVCGDSYTEVLSSTGHAWSDWTPAGDHTTHTRTCSVCDTAETADCEYTVTGSEAATCTEDGYKTYTCSVCGDSYTEVLSSTGHAWGDWTPAGDHATHTRTCSVCDITETADCEYTVTDSEAATCTEDGYKTYTCSACGDSYTEVLSSTGHAWGDWTPAGDHATHTRTCSVCDTTETADCEYTVTDSEAATCTEDGYKTYTCSVCGDSYTEIVGTKGHTYSLVEVAPKNGLDGYLYFVCEECSQVFLYDSGVAGEVTDIETAKNVGAVPSPSFNDYKSENEAIAYDYSLRGSSLKVDPQASLNTQDMRFTAALKIPEGAEVKDFGFVYTQTRFLNSGVEPAQDDNSCYGTEQFVSSNESVYKLSVMADENGKFTRHTTASGIVYTFNLVIGVDKSNWSKHYAARSYIVYEYSGREYIVYDSEYSSRSVEWIARRICASQYEAESTKDFIDEKILKNL